jgi:putative transposase
VKKSRYTEEQIAFALKQAELGTPVAEVCRKMGISDATFYNWRQKYGGLGPSELRRLKQLEEENAKLKRLVADLSLDKAMLQDVLSKMYGPPRLCKASVVDPTHVSLRKCIRPLASRTLLAFRP